MTNQEIEDIIKAELQGNLNVLIDPKQKDSFSDQRINTWVNLVSERLIHHLTEQNDSKKIK